MYSYAHSLLNTNLNAYSRTHIRTHAHTHAQGGTRAERHYNELRRKRGAIFTV